MTTTARIITATLLALLLAYFAPKGYWLIAQERQRTPMFSYSAVAGGFVSLRVEDGKPVYRGADGAAITREQHEELTPFSSWVQLSKDGRLPSHVQGLTITPATIRKAQANLRLHAAAFDAPTIALIPLFDAASGRAKLESPGELLRLGQEPEFLRIEDNTLQPERARRYAQAFEKTGLRLPVRALGYSPSPLKPYDEGCYVSDADGKLFLVHDHAGEPRVRHIPLKDGERELRPVRLFVQEQENREWRVVVHDERGDLYLLVGPNHTPRKLPLGDHQPGKATIGVRSDPLHVHITANDGDTLVINVVKRETFEPVASMTHEIDKDENALRHRLYSWLFPMTLDVETRTSAYYGWEAAHAGWSSLPGALLAALTALLLARRRREGRAFALATVSVCLCLGPIALPAVLLTPKA